MTASTCTNTGALLALGIVALQLTACTSTSSAPHTGRRDLPTYAPQAKTPARLEPFKQTFPNCLPVRVRSSDGRRAYLGIHAATCLNAKGQPAAFVVGLGTLGDRTSSPAQTAGLQVGDEVMGLDACGLRSAGDLTIEIEGIPPGAATTLAVRRNDQEFLIRVPSVVYTPRDPELARRPRRDSTSHCESLQLGVPR